MNVIRYSLRILVFQVHRYTHVFTLTTKWF